jgi:disulfide bond formation protein DsbB
MNMSTSVSLPDGTKLPIRVRYFMYHNEAVVQQGTESVTVANGSLKFTFEMDNWPFKGTQNYVFLHTAITSSDVVSYSALLRPSGQVRRLAVHPTQSHNDSLFIDFPITGILDRQNHNIDIKVQSGVSASAGAAQFIDLVFAFPYFSQGLSYDPNVGLEIIATSSPLDPAPPTLSLALIITLVAIALAVVIFGLVLAIQSYRRWRDRQRYSRMI